MGRIFTYIRNYFFWVNKQIFFASSLFIALFIFVNYYFKLQAILNGLPTIWEYAAWYFIFLAAFVFPHCMQALIYKRKMLDKPPFIFLLVIAPALFAWKMVSNVHFYFSADTLQNAFWNKVMYWPFKLFVLMGCLFILWKMFDKEQPFYGLSTKDFSLKPYFLMLLVMVPLIAAATTQPDFLRVYPKLMRIEGLLQGENVALKKMLYEISYGIDFISIELFFRGFLILAFAKWIGKEAILPMALFYCTIHFGKPLGECISSFFGGLILGTVTYHTRSIYGGLIVHLGIAWLMELSGYIGHAYFL